MYRFTALLMLVFLVLQAPAGAETMKLVNFGELMEALRNGSAVQVVAQYIDPRTFEVQMNESFYSTVNGGAKGGAGLSLLHPLACRWSGHGIQEAVKACDII